MKRFLIVFLLLFSSCVSSTYNSCIRVVEIIDGDTIRLENGKLLRFIGIDTPEMRVKKETVWIDHPQPFARQAKAFTRTLLGGECVRIEFDVERVDKYGRLLGYVFLDDRCINTLLLEEGIAVLYTRPPNVKYTEEFLAAQTCARDKKKGLWGAYAVVSAEEADECIGQIRTVKGKVQSTYQSKKCVFLNFGSNWRQDFTLVIFNNSLPYFRRKGIEPVTFYRNKWVEATGRIREYNGPEIIVNVPEEIRVLEE